MPAKKETHDAADTMSPEEQAAMQAALGATAGSQLRAALQAPFAASLVKWKPGVLAKEGDRCLAMPYIDARLVQARLDEVFGVGGWQDAYDEMDDGCVQCRLSVCVNGVWVAKADIGSPSEQTDEGDRHKAAYSDALKRAAVKLGIGRYLYAIPPQWTAYDKVKRRITKNPTVPAEFLTPRSTVTGTAQSKSPPATAEIPHSPPLHRPETTEPQPINDAEPIRAYPATVAYLKERMSKLGFTEAQVVKALEVPSFDAILYGDYKTLMERFDRYEREHPDEVTQKTAQKAEPAKKGRKTQK